MTNMLQQLSGTCARALAAAASAILIAACGGTSSDVPEGDFVPPRAAWELVFEDNFDGNSLDTSKWNIELGDGCPDLCGWGNAEVQIYTPDNITVANGTLTIQGRQELDGTYTSARINTKGKFDFRYGRVEVRARLPVGQGVWPAIWMLHSDPSIYGVWPRSGEIDIMEAFNPGNGNNEVRSTTHYGLPTPPFNGTGSGFDLGVSPDMAFHVYEMEWEKDSIRFYVDGQHFQTQKSDQWYTYYPADEQTGLYNEFGAFRQGEEDAPFNQLFHLIINLAIGGNPVGNPDPGAFPQDLEIDYVRVYKCANSDPDTRLGCGRADLSAVVLKDNDGGPLEAADTAQPYTDALDLYTDGPETIELSVGADIASNSLQPETFGDPGATVVSEPLFSPPGSGGNIAWHVMVSGGNGGVALASEDLSNDQILDTGFNFSDNRKFGIGGDAVGEIAFRMRVDSLDPGAQLVFRLDSGNGDAGEIALPESEILIGQWKTYSVKFRHFRDNPLPGGNGVDFAAVLKPFVLEVRGGAAELLVDDIRATTACKVVSACGVDLKVRALPDLVVYDDAVDLVTWDVGINGADSGSNFANYGDPSDPNNKVNWREIPAPLDPARGNVLEVTFNDSSAFGVWFIQSTVPRDLSAYSEGAVEFDIKVLDYANNTAGMTMKIDCVFPCTSNDRPLGRIADGVWETVSVPVASLIATGLDVNQVNTGLVVFPTAQNQVGKQVFLLDNIRWVSTTTAPPLQQIDLPVTFDDLNTNYTMIDFEGQGTFLTTDPDDPSNQVAQTTKGVGAQTFAGTIVGTSEGFANPIPFTATEQALSLRVRPPAAGIPILLKIENADASATAEVQVNTTVANQWETLVFDFSSVGININTPYKRAILFFDFGNIGSDTTFLWDDLQLAAGGGMLQQIDLPVTFDDPNVNYVLTDFGGTVSALVNDPDPANAGNRVAQTVKSAGAATFAGTTLGSGTGFANPIPFTPTATRMSVRVWVPTPGIPVRLKVENADASVTSEVQVQTTVSNQWETLVFDFANAGIDTTATFVQAVIFFDFGNFGNDATYYWDDLQFGP
ncbi:MAG: glycoside hydrolase family 16 protein [Gammaproteobacteria bacterium]|nr:MAG: glycoside hydrolase family 16 protein [Gammaproteobacteria bacterium]